MNPKVTIGVCLKDCEITVERIIDVINSQVFPKSCMETIFVDDGSKDNTLFSIMKHAQKINTDYRIHAQNWKGLGFSRNFVSKNARGNYIVWIDDGTIIPRDYVSKHVEFMDEHPSVGIARGVIGRYSGSNTISILENLGQLIFNSKHAGKSIAKLPGTAGSIYRVKAIRQVGGFDEEICGAAEDTDIAYRLISAGWQIYMTQIQFQIDHNEKIREAWNKARWYGYGGHFVLHKHKGLSDISYKSTPIAGALEGVLASYAAYKITRRKLSFLLPLFYFLTKLAWNIGFVHGHFDKYGHIK